MREISCRMLEVLFRQAAKEGQPFSLLAEGTPYPVEFLRDKNERIEWDVFVRVNANASRIWSPEQLEAIGGAFFASPLVRSVLVPARLLFTPRGLYRWVLGDSKGLGRHMVPSARNLYRELDPSRAELFITFPEEYAHCPEFFTITKGAISGLPRALGMDGATVGMTWVPAGARYEIAFPAQKGILPAIRRAATTPFTIRATARELKDANEALQQRYAELEDYRLNLERKVEERTAELERTIRELKEAQETRDKLFANINHEIRTPLSQVVLQVADVRDRDGARIAPESNQALVNIERASRRLTRLIDDLLLLAARQEGRLHLRLGTSDLSALLRQQVDYWRAAAKAQGLRLSYDGPERCVVRADEHALERIADNLLSNALKFTPSGGSVEVALSEPSGDTVEISVRDTGVGLDEEFKKRIFGRFEQGRAPVHAGSRGSGIGLAIVKELALAHGGSVEADGRPGGGTLFRVRLPRMAVPDAAVHEDERDGYAAMPTRSGPQDFGIRGDGDADAPGIVVPAGTALGTILVAEDDPDLRRSIANALGRDYRVLLAADGITALDLARQHQPDLLVTDIGMPGMEGLELTRRFRALQGNRLAPVLVVSAYGAVGDRMKGLEAGAVDYLVKPFSPEELRARVRSQLAVRAMALRLHEGEKLATIGSLSAGLAHELRNPANGIVNAIEPLRSLIPAEVLRTEPAIGELLEVVEHCATQIGHLSRQLLGLRTPTDLSRVRHGFRDLLQRSLALVATSLDRVEFRNASRFDGELECAGPMIVQVLANLLENGAHAAAAAARENGTPPWVRLESRLEGDLVVIEVADSGSGVPRDLRERIFEPFFTTKPPGVGTGLGLTTAREIAQRHGGGLDVRPSGEGTAFRLELPRLIPAAPSGEAARGNDPDREGPREPIR